MPLSKKPGAVAQSESDTNLTGRRAAWQARALDEATRALLAEDERYFPAPVGVDAVPQRHRQGRGHLDRGRGRPALHGFPRQQRAPHRLRPSAPEEGHRRADGGAAVRAAPLRQRAGRGAGEASSRTSRRSGRPRCCSPPAARMPSRWRSRSRAPRPGGFKTLSFWDAFHGAGIGAGALSGEALFRSGPAAPLVAGAVHVAPFGSTRCPYGTSSAEASGEACARMIEYVLEREGDIAALVAEPIRAVPYLPPAGFWARVRAACDRHGTLLVFDEIPTGLGKTGAMFACQHDGVAPDILVLGKGLGGGILPIAAVLARPELDVGAEWAFGHYTHEKNPVTARAALTTIEIIEDEGLVENAARVGAIALERLHRAEGAQSRPSATCAGRGLLIGIELVRDRAGMEPDQDLAEATMYAALDRGLSFKTTMGNVLTLTPPLTITEDEMLPRARHRRGGNRGCAARFATASASETLSSRALCPGSIVPLAPAPADGWMPGTSPGMTSGWGRFDGRQSRVRRAEGGGDRRHHRHGAGGHGRHAGPADRQALPGRVFRRRRARGDARLRLPARQRHRHGAGAGLRGGELGQGLRRFRAQAGPRHAAQGALARRHGAGAVRRARPSPPRRAAFAARHAQAPDRAPGGPEDARLLRLRARVLPVRRDLQVGGGQALRRGWRRPAPTSRTITSSRPARRRA